MRRTLRRPAFLLLASTALLPACGRRAAGVRYPDAGEGHFVARWTGGARLLDAPARATYCRGDSLLVIIAVDGRWSAGVVTRGAFPPAATRRFAVRPSLAGDGTAAAAFRAVTGSVQPAVMALRGSVEVDTGRLASGRFEIGAAPSPGRSDPIHLVGAFRSLPTTDSDVTCGSLPRTP